MKKKKLKSNQNRIKKMEYLVIEYFHNNLLVDQKTVKANSHKCNFSKYDEIFDGL